MSSVVDLLVQRDRMLTIWLTMMKQAIRETMRVSVGRVLGGEFALSAMTKMMISQC